MNSLRPQTLAGLVGLMGIVGSLVVAGCSGDDDGDDSAIVPVVTLEADFAGDAFDAACALLERSDSGDPVATVDAVFDHLAEDADDATARNTLELAVADRCPDWQEPLDEALADRTG